MARKIVLTILLGSVLSTSGLIAQVTSEPFTWSRTENHIALRRGDSVIWQLNVDNTQDKPYFYPLRTPSGLDMTLERPDDHPWHRGLWFSWKTINGVNYWEENPETGLSDGRSVIKRVKSKLGKKTADADIHIWMEYSDSSKTVLTERRRIEVGQPTNGGYLIKSYHHFKATADVELYLEKPAKHGGVEWGGYAGFSFRGSNHLHQPEFLASSGWTNSQDLTGYGEKERWLGINAKNNGKDVALVIFDHTNNERHPSPWYIWYAIGHNLFFTPSLLFDGPLKLKKGDTLALQYAVWVMDGRVSSQIIESQYSAFSTK